MSCFLMLWQHPPYVTVKSLVIITYIVHIKQWLDLIVGMVLSLLGENVDVLIDTCSFVNEVDPLIHSVKLVTYYMHSLCVSYVTIILKVTWQQSLTFILKYFEYKNYPNPQILHRHTWEKNKSLIILYGKVAKLRLVNMKAWLKRKVNWTPHHTTATWTQKLMRFVVSCSQNYTK